jgi:type I restriction enzyme M protein
VDKAPSSRPSTSIPSSPPSSRDERPLSTQWRKKSAEDAQGAASRLPSQGGDRRLAEDLLAHYTDQPLIDRYDVYQHLMDYWAETMQDDCYLIAADGWKAETYRIIETDKKGKEKDKGLDLRPGAQAADRRPLLRQGTGGHRRADRRAGRRDRQLAELEEEHGGEEGAFCRTGQGEQGQRRRAPEGDQGRQGGQGRSRRAQHWLKLNNQEAELKKKLKDAEADLDAKAYAHYPKLTEAEIKTLVVDDKWLAALDAAIHGEMDRISQSLTQRVKELAERYETPMPQMTDCVANWKKK